MSTALKLSVLTPSETSRSERPHTPANDNQHLHLVATKTEGTCHNLSRSSAFVRPDRARQTHAYDMSDQPTAISGSGPGGIVSGTYIYDGNLKRVRSIIGGKTIYNVYDAGGTLIHVDQVTDGKKTDYIGKVARVTTSGGVDVVTYLHHDHLGSANTGTDYLGNVLWREQYTPFGSTLTSPIANNDQAGFTGHIKDSATGLNYMQARYYDPLIGRFLSIDPIDFTPANPGTFNRYTYALNNPVNHTDPDGMQAVPLPELTPPPPPQPANDNVRGQNSPNPGAMGLSKAGVIGAALSLSGSQSPEAKQYVQESAMLDAYTAFQESESGSGNRVTVQAQGDKIRKGPGTVKDTANGGNMTSAPAVSPQPIPRAVVHGQLVATKRGLNGKDQRAMAPAFAKAHAKVNNMVGFTGHSRTGVGGGVSQSEYRVDIDVVGTIGP